MPYVYLQHSPLALGAAPVRIYFREAAGEGGPLVFLHSGWGYESYPFDRQVEAFQGKFRILIPDRTGYGRSSRIEDLPTDFHQRAAAETMSVLKSLGVGRAVLWGHSDGAVIAAMMGLAAPEQFAGLVLEAFHYYRVKESSRGFFEKMASAPETLGERMCGVLSDEHGEDYWRRIIQNAGRAWLRLADESKHPKEDLYGGRLSKLSPPTILIHGRGDPRTENDELAAVSRQLPSAPLHVIDTARHSPHSEGVAAPETIRIVSDFLRRIAGSEGSCAANLHSDMTRTSRSFSESD